MAEATLTPSVKRVAPRLNQSFPSLLLSVVISSCFDRAGKAFFHTDKQTLKPQEATAAGAKAASFFRCPEQPAEHQLQQQSHLGTICCFSFECVQ